MPHRENTRSLSPVGGDMQKSEKAGVPILPTEHLLCAYSTIGTYPINTVEHFRDAAVELGHCSVCAYGYQPDSTEPQNACDFAYAHQKNIRLFQAICSCEGSLEAALRAGYDGAQISYPYGRSLISRIEALESRMGKPDEGFFNTA